MKMNLPHEIVTGQKKRRLEGLAPYHIVGLALVILIPILIVGVYLWGEYNRYYADKLFQLLEVNDTLKTDNISVEDVQLILNSSNFRRVDCSELQNLGNGQGYITCVTPVYVEYNREMSNSILMYFLSWSNYLIEFDFLENKLTNYTISRFPMFNS